MPMHSTPWIFTMPKKEFSTRNWPRGRFPRSPVERCSQAGIVVFNTPGANANAVAELDVLAALAQVAAENNYCRPVVDDSDELTIEPFDYKDHDVLVSADSAALLDALRTAETAALDLAGEWEKIAAFRRVLATLPAPEEKKPAAAPKAEAAAPAAAEKKPAATVVEKKPEAVKPAAEAAEKKPAAAPAAKTAAVKPAAKATVAKPAVSAKKPAASAARKSSRKSK